mmetsp:Transcript_686/g.1424  ORF Transcript_686/g.1424 Transcript_686/m.1424 type:complete len:470 (-) Transcript_686:113-1522(-)
MVTLKTATPGRANGRLPPHLRLGLPVLILGNIALFLCSHFLKGGSTQITATVMNKNMDMVAGEDNLISASRRLAQSGAWGAVCIVALLSGVWPYVKLLGTLGCLALVDFGVCGYSRSYRGLVILETVGKWSFGDVFLIVINIVIFDISTGGPYSLVGLGEMELHMQNKVHFAGLALIIAVAFSSCITHWAAHELRRLELEDISHEDEAERTPLLDQEDLGSKTMKTDADPKRKWLAFMAGLTLVMSTTSIAFIIVGSSIPYMEVDRHGFLGNLIRPKEDKKLFISIFSTTQRLWEGDKMYQTFGALCLIFSFVMPVLEVVMIAVSAIGILRSGISSKLSRFSRFASDACHSLACIDMVLIVGAIVVAELHTVVGFNIGNTCKPFEMMLTNKVLLDAVGLGFAASDSCFDPKPKIQTGFWWLLSGLGLRIVASRLLPARYITPQKWAGSLRKSYPQVFERNFRPRVQTFW